MNRPITVTRNYVDGNYNPARPDEDLTTVTTYDAAGNAIASRDALSRTSTFGYDPLNRLITTTLSGVTTQFSYNGDGARLKQIIAGVPTTYTQDLAAPLPVVLQSKTGANAMQYVYALGTRPLAAARNGGAWEYLLPDALGSVRQTSMQTAMSPWPNHMSRMAVC